ncbi:3-hydroxyacyl-CoA dehydrogenase/enoyl-CoA hydratase family protein [Capnocytophaga canis]|uniref:Putative 3-hydroxyacyl-CoA dehydrogenase n=1 Tax=Capnocytophaga canis TaxID=1848903 RepID=A0A0B7IT52_9FLAO|nr:3-hydroxyacyl-CoA dehydrogenase/enoyl-CoA hydratase family protein [Capnocytophaga canis]CEN53212.1 putative 3-hydroxyacyl-CoA dehydrogenase [Capnocytophaga canis]
MRRIKKIAVIGSGVMGSSIACHFANIGVKVLLLDIVPTQLNHIEQKKGFSLSDKVVKNRITSENLEKILKSNPSPIYHPQFAKRIEIGNLADDLPKIADVDWIVEAVTENLEIKKSVFEKLEQYRKQGTLITSNTSGLPVHFLSEGRSEDFRKHFAITHFFNPPRYLQLLEIIPSADCQSDVVDFLFFYSDNFLGKTPVLAKNTPAFIGNRIGIFVMMHTLHQIKWLNLKISEIDALTGTIIGRPKSATFRTADVVGLDTLVHVAKGVEKNSTDNQDKHLFQIPDYVLNMLKNNWLGAKSGQGFYKKIDKEIFELDLRAMEYVPCQQVVFPLLNEVKKKELKDRFLLLIQGDDNVSLFYKRTFAALFAYIQNRIPEISDTLYQIDDAVRAGFGWQIAPFEIWDAIGLAKGVELMQSMGYETADWIQDMLRNNQLSFYKLTKEATYFYDIKTKKYRKKVGQEGFIILDNFRSETLWKNDEASIINLGDGILNLEFHSKMNTIGGGILEGIHRAIDFAEEKFQGIVIGNQAENFSVGANIAMIYAMATAKEYEKLNQTIAYFQNTMMRLRYSSIPTVAAIHGMTLGGGCELSLHTDKVVATAETYIGLVEFGVGLIPGGGGSKELTVKASDGLRKGDVILNRLQDYFLTIAMAKVSKSAYEAFDWDILQKGKDIVVVNRLRLIAEAKKHALLLAEAGYTRPIERDDIKVFGRQSLGAFLVGTDSMREGKYITDYDKRIADKLAYVMSGGDLSEPTLVSEQYLLDLEREAFLSLCTEPQTLERIAKILK